MIAQTVRYDAAVVELNMVSDLRDLQPCVATGVDAGKRREIHIDVQSEAVITAPAPDAQAQRGDLFAFDVDAGSVSSCLRYNPKVDKQRDDGILDGADQAARAELRAPEIDQQINHELPRPVIRHLPTAIALHHRNVTGMEYVFAFAVQTKCEYRRMFHHPHFVCSFGATLRSKSLHCPPDRNIGGVTEMFDDWTRPVPRRHGHCRRAVHS